MQHTIHDRTHSILVILDTGDNKMMRLASVENDTAENSFTTFLRRLISILDPPVYTVVDRGTNLAAQYMADKLRSLQSQRLPIGCHRPFQIGGRRPLTGCRCPFQSERRRPSSGCRRPFQIGRRRPPSVCRRPIQIGRQLSSTRSRRSFRNGRRHPVGGSRRTIFFQQKQRCRPGFDAYPTWIRGHWRW